MRRTTITATTTADARSAVPASSSDRQARQFRCGTGSSQPRKHDDEPDVHRPPPISALRSCSVRFRRRVPGAHGPRGGSQRLQGFALGGREPVISQTAERSQVGDWPEVRQRLHRPGGLRLLNPGSPTDRRRQPHCTYLSAVAVDGRLAQLTLHRLPPRQSRVKATDPPRDRGPMDVYPSLTYRDVKGAWPLSLTRSGRCRASVSCRSSRSFSNKPGAPSASSFFDSSAAAPRATAPATLSVPDAGRVPGRRR